MVSHFGTKLLGLSVVGAIALINSGSANAAEFALCCLGSSSQWTSLELISGLSQSAVTSGRVNVKN